MIDCSGGWREPEAQELLGHSQYVIAVGDPYAAKWQLAELKELAAMKQQLHQHGGELLWLANKDLKFPGREDWLSLFPGSPSQ